MDIMTFAAAKSYTNKKIANGEATDLSNYYTKQEIDNKGFITTENIPETSAIDTVPVYSELPTDAKENDVAIVEEEEYIRTENKTTVLPIEVKLNTEDQEIPNIYSINFKDKFDTLLNKEELKNMGAEQLNVGLEFEYSFLYYMDVSTEMVQAMMGVNHPIRVIQYSDFSSELEQMNFYIEGMSIKDLCTLILDLGELEEDQWNILLGSHVNDSSEDNPSYGWVSFVLSNDPINENSLDFDGAYATVIFDAEVPKFNDMLGSISLNILDANGETITDVYASTYSYYESSDYDPKEVAFAIKYANLVLNNIAHGGIIEQSNDIYNPKGLFQNDNGEWVSLEEKMNTPRFVNIYADLPKTSIENGIMAVAQESIYKSNFEITTKLELFKKYRINSVGDMTAEIFNSIIDDLLPGYPSEGDIEAGIYMASDQNSEFGFNLIRYPYNDTENICYIQMNMYAYDYNGNLQGKMACCFVELPTDFDAGEIFPMDKDSGELLELYPEAGKWYWCNIVENESGKTRSDGGVREDFPTELPEELVFYGGDIYWNEEIYPVVIEADSVSTYESDPSNYKHFTSIDMKVFNFEDLSNSVSITYPAGFYRYNNNEWKYVDGLTGGNFDNEDVLRFITAEDIGNIQENTEKRHEHNNKEYLDQIGYYTLDNINQNTSARHTHFNKSYLDQINNQFINNINSNTNARHTHSNLSTLNRINNAMVDRLSNITQSLKTNNIEVEVGDDTDVVLLCSISMEPGYSNILIGVSLTPGQYYLVIFDDVKYKCQCIQYEDGSLLLGDESKYGFHIYKGNDGFINWCVSDTNRRHTISIYSMGLHTTNLVEYIYDRINNIEATTVSTDTISTKSVSTKSVSVELPDEANVTPPLFSGLISGTSGTSLGWTLGSAILTLNQTYLVVLDDIEYKFVCTQNGFGELYLGDYSKYGFVIKQDNNETNIYTPDDGRHDLSISVIEPSVTDLADYINALELRISYLESKLQS